MPYKSVLETAGYAATFSFFDVKRDDLLDDLAIKTSIDLNVRATGKQASMALLDHDIYASSLRGLSDYFETHIANLQQDPGAIAPFFVNPGLDFQIQALIGEAWRDEEVDKIVGGFALRFSLNVGEGADGSDVFFGAEAQVYIHQIENFTASLAEFLQQVGTLEH